jgi:hypothetical protein
MLFVQWCPTQPGTRPSPTSSQRRVSFAEDVWVKEIPRVDESDLPTLFYSEADIDGMYQEAEGEWRCGDMVVVVVVVGLFDVFVLGVCCWVFCFCEICPFLSSVFFD